MAKKIIVPLEIQVKILTYLESHSLSSASKCFNLHREVIRKFLSPDKYQEIKQKRILNEKPYSLKKRSTLTSKEINEKRRKHYQKNREYLLQQSKNRYKEKNQEIKIQRKILRDKNKEKNRKISLEYYYKNKDSILIKRKKYAQNNKEKINKHRKERFSKNPNIRLAHNIRSRIRYAVGDAKKSDLSMNLLGCSIEKARKHIESQFEPWMNWENHGQFSWERRTWQIDHIRPCSSFDLTDPNQQKICFNYKNLQPLCAKRNLSKSNKLIFSFFSKKLLNSIIRESIKRPKLTWEEVFSINL